MPDHPDTIDLSEVAGAIRRGWRQVVAGIGLGLLAAAAVLRFVPRQFTGTATVLLKSTQTPEASLLTGMATPTDLMPTSLSGALQSPFETELQILTSRAVSGEVVDSLGLQARILAPWGTAPSAILSPATYPGSFKRQVFRFSREGDAALYRVRGAGFQTTARPGQPVALPVGTVTLRKADLPFVFEVEVLDREDAITRLEKQLTIRKAGGDVARVSFRTGDSLDAAAVPNAVIASYLERRRTTDRGVNQRRLEFLVGFADTLSRRLVQADARLRLFADSSGVLDPELLGKVQLERGTALRQLLEQAEVEEATLGHMIAGVQTGSLSPRQLAAYPSFLKSPAINELLSQMATLETQRLKLVELRTEHDPEVQALEQSIQNLEGQLRPLATAYVGALARQRQTLALQFDTVQEALEALPGQAQRSVELQRDIRSLSQTYLALQVQIVDARLAAISEGGNVHQIDVAEPPRKAAFPPRAATALVGLALGLVIGCLGALKSAYLGRWIRRPEDVERAAGVPGLALEPGAPLLLGDLGGARSILVVPLSGGADASAVTRRLGAAAQDRETAVAVADVSTDGHGTAGAARPAIRQLEEQHQLVIAQAPGLRDSRTAALLEATRPVLFVAQSGRLARRELIAAVETLRRLGIPCSGVVLHGAEPDGDRRS